MSLGSGGGNDGGGGWHPGMNPRDMPPDAYGGEHHGPSDYDKKYMSAMWMQNMVNSMMNRMSHGNMKPIDIIGIGAKQDPGFAEYLKQRELRKQQAQQPAVAGTGLNSNIGLPPVTGMAVGGQVQGGMFGGMGMSGGGNGQMPMASNQGQQMQNPQMGQQGNKGMMLAQSMGGFGGNPGFWFRDQPQMGHQAQQAQQIPPQGMGIFGGGQQMAPAVGAGIAALGGQMPMGSVIDYASPRFPPQDYMPQNYDPSRGQQFLPRDQNGNPIYGAPGGQTTSTGGVNPYQQNPNQVDMRPTNMGPGRGMPPGYRPTNGPIDGRNLRDMMDISRRRPMGNMGGEDDRGQNRLPGAIGNDLPPSLKRPTQGDYKNFK